MKLLVYQSFILLLLVVIHCNARYACNPRDYKLGAPVCVCNATYCDDIDPIKKTERGVITLWETSYSGDRVKPSELKFGNKETVHIDRSQMITVIRKKTYQKIIGFGGSITDATGINIASLPTTMQTNLINDYFSANGLEYNTIRVPIGGSDFSTHPYSYDDVAGDESLEHFNLTKEDLTYKIPYLQMAQKVSPHKVKVFGSPWSSPAWMKTNNAINHGGFLLGEVGGKYYQIWANYFVKFLEAYKSHNITIWGLTVENEPKAGNDSNYGFNSLGMTPTSERDFVKLNLGPTLAKAGFGLSNGVELMIFDDQRTQILNWAHVILNDSAAAKYVSGIAFHWYDNKPSNIWELDKTHDLYPNYFILNTESCCGIGYVLDQNGKLGHSWNMFEEYAYDIITDLNHWTTGWVDWNMALNINGGPKWDWNDSITVDVNKPIDGGRFNLAPIIVNATAREYYKNPTFYAMAHFSKFITPGSVRVFLVGNVTVENFETTAFVRPDNSTVVVALNLNQQPVMLTINDPELGTVERVVKANSIQSYVWFH